MQKSDIKWPSGGDLEELIEKSNTKLSPRNESRVLVAAVVSPENGQVLGTELFECSALKPDGITFGVMYKKDVDPARRRLVVSDDPDTQMRLKIAQETLERRNAELKAKSKISDEVLKATTPHSLEGVYHENTGKDIPPVRALFVHDIEIPPPSTPAGDIERATTASAGALAKALQAVIASVQQPQAAGNQRR